MFPRVIPNLSLKQCSSITGFFFLILFLVLHIEKIRWEFEEISHCIFAPASQVQNYKY